eukprot:2926660-Alexandrium_andersonii.AAC.1
MAAYLREHPAKREQLLPACCLGSDSSSRLALPLPCAALAAIVGKVRAAPEGQNQKDIAARSGFSAVSAASRAPSPGGL